MKYFITLCLLTLLLPAVSVAQNKEVDWNEAYQKLLSADPAVRKKVENGQATKAEVIKWLMAQSKENGATEKDFKIQKKGAKKPESQDSNSIPNPSSFQKKLAEMVESGKLSKEEAAKLAATMQGNKKETPSISKVEKTDWESEYKKLMENPTARAWIEKKNVPKEQVIEYLKGQAAKKTKPAGKGRTAGSAKRPDLFQFYALVIGRLVTKDSELGEMQIDVDYVISENPKVNSELVGQRVRMEGVSGQYLDSLLRIKRGETIKVRTGTYDSKTKVLGFGYKFHVLETTEPFEPNHFGIPPDTFRGFAGELTGKIIYSTGYEVLLEVEEVTPTENSRAETPNSITGKRIRIAGFFNGHQEAYADLSAGDQITVSVVHRNPNSDAVTVTQKLEVLQ
ncbi:MAG: hypothetical protein VXZ38_06620 [Planctomycetota bacterium]|nr:hypothetical protein [Planctomycetota bacterium]